MGICAAVLVPAMAVARPISAGDLLGFRWIGDFQVAPSGDRVVYVRTVALPEKKGYRTSLWTVSTNSGAEPLALADTDSANTPRWSPDGTYLAFHQGEQSMLWQVQDGNRVTLDKGAYGLTWSADSKFIAYWKTAEAKESSSDVQVITNAAYRRDGGSYIHNRTSQAWIYDVSKGEKRALGSPQRSPMELQFHPDGKRLYFASDVHRNDPAAAPETDLNEFEFGNGAQRRLVRLPMWARGFRLAPDGKRWAFRGIAAGPVRSYDQQDVWTLDAGSWKTRNLTSTFDFDMGSGVSGDQPAPVGGNSSALQWSRDGRQIFDVAAMHGSSRLVAVEASSGKVQPLTPEGQAVIGFSRNVQGVTVVKRSTPTELNELVRCDGSQPQQLTSSNPQIEVSAPEELVYKSFDGRTIQGWIQKPPDFQPDRKYPLILNVHGGPHAAYGWVFDHEFQVMAARGYLVLYVNPRGSTSYGQEFGNIIQYRYPGDDYLDLMAGVDAVIERGYVDEKKLGITGGSGGGLLTNWAVTQTKRFAAAVSQRDIADWTSWWYTSDMVMFQPEWFRKPPFEDPLEYTQRSPLTYVRQIDTPMMFVLGDNDIRTPATAGGETLFRALRYLKKPALMVRFPRESHDLSRSGEPQHRVERIEHIIGWFDHWLLGKSNPQYTNQK